MSSSEEVRKLKGRITQLEKTMENILDLHSGWICDCYVCTSIRKVLGNNNDLGGKNEH